MHFPDSTISHSHLACCHSFPHPLSFVSASEKCGVKKKLKKKLTVVTESARSILQTAGKKNSLWGGTADMN